MVGNKNTAEKLAEVAVPAPLRRTFTYAVPESAGEIEPGCRVLVPFGKSRQVGYYLGVSQERPRGLKRIADVLDPGSLLSPSLVRFCRWMADYYFANPAECLAAAFPAALRGRRPATYAWADIPEWLPARFDRVARAGRTLSAATIRQIRGAPGLWSRLSEGRAIREVDPEGLSPQRPRITGYSARDSERWTEVFPSGSDALHPFAGIRSRKELLESGWTDYRLRRAIGSGLLEPVRSDDPETLLDFVKGREDVLSIQPNPEQAEVTERLCAALGEGFRVFLLHGVTGSGKTLVYCHVCREALRRGLNVLVLTPEIALSGTTLAYFRGFFGDAVTVLHSGMSDRERLASWRGLRDNRFRIAIGPRSALFAPLTAPGMVIVDEEHDSSYKQDDPAPRFHGRDAAIMRGKIENVPVLLGSASPSFESYHHARSGRYELLRLTRRPAGVTLPTVHVTDMAAEGFRTGVPFVSSDLKARIDARLDSKEQVILYLNRRGYAPFLKCGACGKVPGCPDCRVNLAYHKSQGRLVCHYCGHVEPAPKTCPACRTGRLEYLGTGTQRVEEAVAELFDRAVVIRLDSDSAAGRRRGHDLLAEFAERRADMLLGTQMVAKGLDFPGVTLVGVISADLALDMPDFRASEKAFARLIQVAGRSGRSQRRGEVVIQTYYAHLPLIDEVARQDYESFFEREIESRRELGYPPFARLVNFVLSAKDEKTLERGTRGFREGLRKRLGESGLRGEVLGPAPCPLYRLKGRYRRHLLLKTTQVVRVVHLLSDWERSEPGFGLPASLRIAVDVDPDNMM